MTTLKKVTRRKPLSPHIRWAVRRDLPAIVAADAVTEEEMLSHLQRRDTIAIVAEVRDQVVGYAVYRLRPDLIRLIRIGVAPEYRRRGVGRALVAKLLGKLSSHRRGRLDVVVPLEERATTAFFAAAGGFGWPASPGRSADGGEATRDRVRFTFWAPDGAD